MTKAAPAPSRLRERLLRWYDARGRDLPWRRRDGVPPAPYGVWLSEIMLQQTTVATVRGYYGRFLDRWPAVGDLAAAPLDDVLHAWQGLGYYARARNLHRCARVVATDHGGRFPDTEHGLRALPGVGPYTAAAIAAIAFARPAAPVDGNIARVVTRLRALDTPWPKVRETVEGEVRALVGTRRPGDFVQAMMDLGATVCTPRDPDCGACPWAGACAARAAGRAADFPVKAPRRAKPVRRGVAFWITDPTGAVLLRRRPERGLLGGMMEVPSTDWAEQGVAPEDAPAQAPAGGGWTALPGLVRHTFTHFHLELSVLAGRAAGREAVDGVWCPVGDLGAHALPTVMRKVCDHALRFG
ncbi:MAG: A/G-specific adenine glycosylase [Hyphomicrobiales bacterium]|nr:A/G-specific adenine glycosylase [Hyphomicrobiales bacterium]